MSLFKELLNRNGPAYALAGAACLGCITLAIHLFGSIRLVPEDRAVGMALGVLATGAATYVAAGMWFIPRHARAKELYKLDAWRFAEFASAGLGAWIGFVLSAIVWNVLFGQTYGYFAWSVFAFLAILPTGFCSVHAVFLLHTIRRRLQQ